MRITQFYAAEPQIAAGGKTLLCYGVENAQSVRLNGERVSPALSRCIEVSPARTTTYTLTAEGGGHKAEQTTTVSVGAPKPPGPKIIEVRVSALKVRPRQAVSICYRVEHASRVSIEPGGPQRSPAEGCLVVQPEHTTTYVVTASAANGAKDTERVTVSVEQ